MVKFVVGRNGNDRIHSRQEEQSVALVALVAALAAHAMVTYDYTNVHASSAFLKSHLFECQLCYSGRRKLWRAVVMASAVAGQLQWGSGRFWPDSEGWAVGDIA